jgi:hypothetical protein
VAAAYELHFEAGRRSLNDVSIAHDDLFEAQRNLIETRAKSTVLRARLLSMTGELREALRTRYHPAPIAPVLLGSKPAVPASAIAFSADSSDGVINAPLTAPSSIAEVEARLSQWAAAWSEKISSAIAPITPPTSRALDTPRVPSGKASAGAVSIRPARP